MNNLFLKCRRSMDQAFSLSHSHSSFFSCIKWYSSLYIYWTKIYRKWKKKNLAGLVSFWSGNNLPELGRTHQRFFVLERSTPQSIFTFSTPSMYFFNPIGRPTNSTAAPIKWSNTNVTCLRLPFAIWKQNQPNNLKVLTTNN